jgi:PIN domain nuclease of toxin-antitoxin system
VTSAPQQEVGSFVLDSYAILALLDDEPGGSEVSAILSSGAGELLMTYVNLGEVLYWTMRKRGEDRAGAALLGLEEAGVTFVPAELSLTLEAARIKARHRLSYADAYCAALSRLTGFPVVTGDPEFSQLEGQIPIRWLETAQPAAS